MTKTLVYGMQSSGATYVAFRLAQPIDEGPPVVAVLDLFNGQVCPPLDEEARDGVVLVKCTISKKVSLKQHIESFRPDHLVLVTRDIRDIRDSLARKPYRNLGGSIDEKLIIYRSLLESGLHRFDQILCYERFRDNPGPLSRSPNEIAEDSRRLSDWCRKNWRKRWGMGALRWPM